MRAIPLADQAARDTIRTALDRTLVVEAAAGTGKTTALVERIIEVIRTGTGELSRLVAVTFTEKAAGELKLRLRAELERARRNERGRPQALALLERGLSQLEEAHIGTIHGFCADLLKERPIEAEIDPLFAVASEEEAERLYQHTFERWLETVLDDPPPGIRRLLRQPVSNDMGPVDRLQRAGWDLIERRDFPARWELRPFDREHQIDELVSRLLALAEKSEAGSPADKLYQNLAPARTFAAELLRQEQASGERDYDYLEHLIPWLDLGKHKGRGPYGKGVSRDDLLAERESLRADLRAFRRNASADLAARLQNELLDLVTRYQERKEKAGRVDFLDLLVRARDLLKNHPALRRELQARFTHVFVDEFQDTDPLQAEILLLLSSDDPDQTDGRAVRPSPGKLFIVADPKQSIYRFRRADVALYQQIKRQLLAAGAELVHLSVSFRSVPDLQEVVNAAFAEVMTGSAEAHQAEYVPLDRHRPPFEGQPAVVVLPIPHPYSKFGNLASYAIQQSEPDSVASWIKWLIEDSGWKVTSRDRSEPHPVSASDVCLLFRRFSSGKADVTRPYVDALQARDIPHVLVGGRGFHQREEIQAMRAALAAIERPDDELAVFATLRGPLFALGDEELFLFRQRHGPLHPFRKLAPDAPPPVVNALDLLARLHKDRNARPIALTLRHLLDATRAQAGFALWQAGDQVLANVLRLLQLARNFEASGGLSFRGFVEQLERQAEGGESMEQPLIEEGVEGVRLMTVHRAKGLEFPVVVLCDITFPMGEFASRHIDPEKQLFAVRLAGGAPWELLDHEDVESRRESAESERLLYVAATRARDLLVVPAVADEPRHRSWVRTLIPALYPPAKAYRFPVVAAGCPPFGEETVLDRPFNSFVPPGDGIKPGEHKPRQGGHRVVWWDAELLTRRGAAKPGIRRHSILEAREGPAEELGARLEVEWRERRAAILDRGSRPLLEIATATRRAAERAGAPAEIRVEIVERVRGRPTGKRFGTLVHEVLASADLDADGRALGDRTAVLARIFGNPPDEVEAAAEAARRALAHPLLASAREASRRGVCHRETPLIHREAGGALVEGVPDLVFRDDAAGEWVVVDFKTDARVDLQQEEYRRQVAIYLEAVRAARGERARGVLLYV